MRAIEPVPSTERRGRFQFGLGTLFALIALTAIALVLPADVQTMLLLVFPVWAGGIALAYVAARTADRRKRRS